jgi:hypothetical protein
MTRKKCVAAGLGAVLLAFPVGGCELDQITATSTVTLDAREVIISAIRGAILTPLDTFITEGVNQLFDEFDSGD